MRSNRAYPVLAAALAIIPLSGCQDIKAIFVKRPSEDMPPYKQVDVQLENQNWSPNQREWFYHTAQGTELLPYKWFLALEQPKIKVFGTVPKFADTAYLARFGFLPDAVSAQNPDGLPVGFARDTVIDPQDRSVRGSRRTDLRRMPHRPAGISGQGHPH